LNKVILVLSDGLRYDVAVARMGMLGNMVETKLASLYKVIGELPSISRPIYETVHTGMPVNQHGVVSNKVIRKSNKSNIFQLVREAGGTSAAAAYYWFSELYNRAPYDPIEDREVDDPSLLIQHGRFYTQDDFPDIELFASAGMLVRRFHPDYLLVHPMGMDYIGGTKGGSSSKYRKHATSQDIWLSTYLAEWVDNGYTILVTGDHGINNDGFHGGSTPEEREVPLFLIRPGIPGAGDTQETISQLQIAPTICRLLGVAIPETMMAAPIPLT
jgi:predicted AlkP superfamily pyrophosphatase or phosphodiesterase